MKISISAMKLQRLLSQTRFTSSFTRYSWCISTSTGQRCLSTRFYCGSPSSFCAAAASQMRISVRTSPHLGGALHCLTVNPTDTVDSLKSVMIRHSSLPMADYLVEFGDKLLDDESDLSSCGITDGDVLSIFKGESYLIEVQVSERSSLVLRADVTETVGSLKAKIKEELALLGTFLKRVNISYKGEPLYQDSRRFLGCHIPGIWDYTIPKQPRKRVIIVLDEECYSDDSEDEMQLWDSREIQPDTVVSSLARFSTRTCIIVFVEVPGQGRRIPLNVTPSDTIEDLLTMSGQPCSGMNLLIGDKKKKLVPIHDGGGGSCTLEECDIKDEDLILVVKAGSFFIHFDIPGRECTTGERTKSMEGFTKYVECSDTIGMVKSKIQDATCIRPDLQRLKYNGWWMDDDTNSLADYGIFDPEDSYTVLVFPFLSPSGEPH